MQSKSSAGGIRCVDQPLIGMSKSQLLRNNDHLMPLYLERECYYDRAFVLNMATRGLFPLFFATLQHAINHEHLQRSYCHNFYKGLLALAQVNPSQCFEYIRIYVSSVKRITASQEDLSGWWGR